MDISNEAELMQSRDIKQIKLSLIKSFTKSVETIGNAMQHQHLERTHRTNYRQESRQ